MHVVDALGIYPVFEYTDLAALVGFSLGRQLHYLLLGDD
jgi:hypothetical protein